MLSNLILSLAKPTTIASPLPKLSEVFQVGKVTLEPILITFGKFSVVRVIGYCLDASNGQIWFNPSSTFVEHN